MTEPTEEQYAEFEQKLEALVLEVFGWRLTRWVLPIIAADDELRSIEDVMVPEHQLLIDTAGLIRFASVNIDRELVQRDDDD